MVTGPSFRDSTCMSAPNSPCSTGKAPLPAAGHKGLVKRDGQLRPGGAGKTRAAGGGIGVQRELGDHQKAPFRLLKILVHLAVFIFKDPQIADLLRQLDGGLRGVVGANAQRTKKPRPIWPLTRPAMVTEAWETRVTTARIAESSFRCTGSVKWKKDPAKGSLSRRPGDLQDAGDLVEPLHQGHPAACRRGCGPPGGRWRTRPPCCGTGCPARRCWWWRAPRRCPAAAPAGSLHTTSSSVG